MQAEDGEEVRVCVDGKQCLTSIVKFLDGHVRSRLSTALTMKPTRSSLDCLFPAAHKGRRNEISMEGKRKFEKRITGISPASEREVFQRVQLGMSISAAKKLQATASPWADYVNELDMKYITISGGLASHVEFDTKRGRTFQNIASMLYCCYDVDLRRTPSAPQLERLQNYPYF
ncbi:hypothetical protein F5148DRAFT_1182268 [Russula earlei]|uniref:Uncharacterized protein n=1 Tax=Russula earlei TaxID=71964 RepID=A0ACC0UFP2_9AGAM|nr:hypothetical protein F5148DRAFT_1182268 [Russula earlei]